MVSNMELNDLYFHGFTLYTKSLEKDKEATKFRRAIRATDVENDAIKTIRLVCKIDEDWVKNIEEGLLFVEKAVREERQFIRTEGEVVPVERAKHTSKTTVEHLAKHSNFITHVPEKETDNLVPDKLYIVEKESDYAVYENRFLYMMLTYLRDFIAIRLNKIRDKMTTYHAMMNLNKNVNMSHRKTHIEIKFTDEIKDDPILIEKYKSIKAIDRIELQYHFVFSLLSTTLMEQVSKAPMLKPPIIKTNTLKMNTNFKTSLALYDYIAAYNKPGYEFEEEEVVMSPFNEETAEDIAESIALQAFLTYKSANGISKDLKKQLEINEKKAREAERIQRDEQLKRLRRRINESNQTLEEYLVILEEHNRDLEKDGIDLALVRKQVVELSDEIKRLNDEVKELNHEIENLNDEIKARDEKIVFLTEKGATDLLVMEQVHRDEIARLKAEHEKEIAIINLEHQNNVANINAIHQEEIAAIYKQNDEENEKKIGDIREQIEGECADKVNKLNKEIDSLNKDKDNLKDKLTTTENNLSISQEEKKRYINDYEDKIYNLQKEHREKISEYEKRISELNDEIKRIKKRHKNEIEDYKDEIDHLIKERQFVEAQLHIIRVEQGKITDEYDYTSKERFEELELQYRAFRQLFKKEWGKTKARIRKEILTDKDSESDELNKEDKKFEAKEETSKEELSKEIENKPEEKETIEEPKKKTKKKENNEEKVEENSTNDSDAKVEE